jgi:hypothetical protein
MQLSAGATWTLKHRQSDAVLISGECENPSSDYHRPTAESNSANSGQTKPLERPPAITYFDASIWHKRVAPQLSAKCLPELPILKRISSIDWPIAFL